MKSKYRVLSHKLAIDYAIQKIAIDIEYYIISENELNDEIIRNSCDIQEIFNDKEWKYILEESYKIVESNPKLMV